MTGGIGDERDRAEYRAVGGQQNRGEPKQSRPHPPVDHLSPWNCVGHSQSRPHRPHAPVGEQSHGDCVGHPQSRPHKWDFGAR